MTRYIKFLKGGDIRNYMGIRMVKKLAILLVCLLCFPTNISANPLLYRKLISPTTHDYYEKVICEGAYETVTFPSESRNIVIINDSYTTSIYIDLEGEEATVDDFELKSLERLSAVGHRVGSITLLSASGTVEVRVYMTY